MNNNSINNSRQINNNIFYCMGKLTRTNTRMTWDTIKSLWRVLWNYVGKLLFLITGVIDKMKVVVLRRASRHNIMRHTTRCLLMALAHLTLWVGMHTLVHASTCRGRREELWFWLAFLFYANLATPPSGH